ncbi:MAG: diaminopimelate decarboxylase [Bacteroidota bacterium]|jgi:diaminopimelate decarboxylase|nr:diaminopimelate decarboxylase [Bacteroidota bacterium]
MNVADGFTYIDRELHCGSVRVSDVVRETGTPLYLLNLDAVLATYERHRDAFSAFSHRTCFAVKANSSRALLQALARAGCGFDVNSRGELYRALTAGANPRRITMTGVGKSHADIRDGLAAGVAFFNAESASECRLISALAEEHGVVAEVLLRLNPDVETDTHPYISTGESAHKFGLSPADIRSLASQASWLPGLRIAGLSMHLGSQILSPAPYGQALRILLRVLDDITPMLDRPPDTIDIGGGFGVRYDVTHGELPPARVAAVVAEVLGTRDTPWTLITEPGRSLVANAGALIAAVAHVKPSAHRNFLILDAGMNDLLRPALYQASHSIIPVRERDDDVQLYDIVGPVCESSDTFATNYALPTQDPGDLVALLSAGAYGSSMSSNYNSRPLAAEAVVYKNAWSLARARQSLDDLVRGEQPLPEV